MENIKIASQQDAKSKPNKIVSPQKMIFNLTIYVDMEIKLQCDILSRKEGVESMLQMDGITAEINANGATPGFIRSF